MTARSSTARVGLVAALVLLCAGALVSAACSDDPDEDAQPAPGGSTFAPGGFDDLPRYRGSAEIGTRSQDGDVVTQSFTVAGASPELIIDFYRRELVGWEETPTEDVGDALRSDFINDGQRLEVSATTLTIDTLGQTPTVQYSLVWHE